MPKLHYNNTFDKRAEQRLRIPTGQGFTLTYKEETTVNTNCRPHQSSKQFRKCIRKFLIVAPFTHVVQEMHVTDFYFGYPESYFVFPSVYSLLKISYTRIIPFVCITPGLFLLLIIPTPNGSDSCQYEARKVYLCFSRHCSVAHCP